MDQNKIYDAVSADVASQIGNMVLELAQYKATAQAMNAEINRLKAELETLKASKPEEKE